MIRTIQEQSSAAESAGAAHIAALTRGFFVSKICFTALELGLFDALEGGALSADALAEQLDTHPDATGRLCAALVALGLLDRIGGRYTNSLLVRRYLVENSPEYMGGIALLWSWDAYPTYQYLDIAIREGPGWWQRLPWEVPPSRVAKDQDRMRRLVDTMRRTSLRTAQAVLDGYDVGAHHGLLELSGGTAELCIAAAQRHPRLRCIFFDQPQICAVADQLIAEAGLMEQVITWPGDLFQTDALPRGADLIVLGQVLHAWEDERALAILRNCADVLPRSGTILIREQLLDPDRAGPIGPVLQNLHMLVLGGGRERTAAEYVELLEEADLEALEVRWLDGPFGLVIGRKSR